MADPREPRRFFPAPGEQPPMNDMGMEEQWLDDLEEYPEEGQERPAPRSVFRPNVKKPNFILCVLVNVIRILSVLVLLAGLAVVGAVAGIAKGYVETAPNLDLAALDDQAQTVHVSILLFINNFFFSNLTFNIINFMFCF